jgi:GNAT superfamily N-acetyltransferase
MNSERPDGIVIRRLDPADSITDLTDLLHRAYRPLAEAGMRFLATHQDEEVTRRRIAKGECYVAVREGRVVGTIVFRDPAATTGCPYYERPGVSCLNQFAVEPELQKHGIGSALMDAVEARAREVGATEIALDTAETATHLIRYYSGRGYRIVDTTRWEVTNYRSVVMSLHLSEPEAETRS